MIILLFLNDLCIGSILLDAGDTILAGFQFLIAFTGSYDLAVRCFQAEAIFLLLILVDLELRVFLCFEALYCLILSGCGGCVFLYADNAFLAGRK